MTSSMRGIMRLFKSSGVFALLLAAALNAGCGKKKSSTSGTAKEPDGLAKTPAQKSGPTSNPFIQFSKDQLFLDINKLNAGASKGEVSFEVLLSGNPRPVELTLSAYDHDGDPAITHGLVIIDESGGRPLIVNHGESTTVPSVGPVKLSAVIERDTLEDRVFTVFAVVETSAGNATDVLKIDVPQVIIAPAPNY